MGANGAQHSTGTQGIRRKFLSTLQPTNILKPNPDPNAHPALSLVLALALALPLTLALNLG